MRTRLAGVACALLLGCTACGYSSTELSLGSAIDVALHRADSGVAMVEITVRPAGACRPAKLALAWGGDARPTLLAKRAAPSCAPS